MCLCGLLQVFVQDVSCDKRDGVDAGHAVECWPAAGRVLSLYAPACQPHFQLWPAQSIPAPWHNTVSCCDLVSAVSRALIGDSVRTLRDL